MKKPDQVLEIFLQPGEYFFGDRDTRIRTLLGSCVSITLWHPQLLIGGMCHYMLPTRPNGRPAHLDARYADDAIELLLGEIRRAGTRPQQFEVQLFGGGQMFPNLKKSDAMDVSSRNVETARQWAKKTGLKVRAEHMGGTGHRNIIFDIWSGSVQVKHQGVTIDAGLTAERGRP